MHIFIHIHTYNIYTHTHIYMSMYIRVCMISSYISDIGFKWPDLNKRLIEACQVSAEDLGFRVATLSPSLRHIPAASTHLPKINCTALTPSFQTSEFNLHTI